MERGFYNEDLEELLKEKADQYKMYPSDKVWKNIHRSLHPNRKWYWLSLLLFIAAGGYFSYVEFITPGNNNKTANGSTPSNTVAKSSTTVTEESDNENESAATAVMVPFGNPSRKSNASTAHHKHNFVLNPEETFTNNSPVAAADNIPDPVVAVAAPNTAIITMADGNEAPVYDIATGRLKRAWQANVSDNESSSEIALNEYNKLQPLEVIGATNTSLAHAAITDASGFGSNTKNRQEDEKRTNWLNDIAVYELQVPKPKRLSWQVAFTPTMNYRTLKGGNNASEVKTLPLQQTFEEDPAKLVNHKPALGFEVGTNLLYAINKTFTFKTGLQFNYIRYDIQAYSSYASQQAVIALNTAYGIGTNAITTYTRYRNFDGDNVQNLHNQFFQLAVPIGLEVNLLGNEKINVGVAGTIQPTYILNKNTYLLTSDYKYTQEPSLVRRWNMNTAAEAFISYKMGDLKWQVGPQFRYQLLSNYVKEYPIREHLMEYGIKLGVTKTIH